MSHAQSITADALCRKITQASSANSAACMQLITRHSFDQGALNVAFRTVDVGSSYAIEVLKVTAGKRIDLNASMVCEKIIGANTINIAPCMGTIADAYVAPELVQIATAVLQTGSSYALAVLKTGVNAYFFAPAANICTAMATINAANVPVCTQIIANKIILNGAEQVCRTALNSGSTYAIDCLRNVVSDYVHSGPVSTTLGIEIQKLQELRRVLIKTRNLLDRNMIENAHRSLDNSVHAVEDILAGPVI